MHVKRATGQHHISHCNIGTELKSYAFCFPNDVIAYLQRSGLLRNGRSQIVSLAVKTGHLLCVAAFGACVSLSTTAVKAGVVTDTITGTITSGFDDNHQFGSGNLAGDNISITFSYDYATSVAGRGNLSTNDLYGSDLISFTVSASQTSMPEPASLLVPGPAVGALMAARRRRRG